MTSPALPVSELLPALVDKARSLGLTWGLRPAVISNVDGSITKAIYDGDTTAIRVTSLVGALAPGQRVMVMFVPPAGNYVIGSLSNHVPGAVIARADRATSSSATTTELAVVRLSKVPVISGLGYQITSSNLILDSTVDGDTVLARLRFTDNGVDADLADVLFGGVKSVSAASSGQVVLPILRNYYPTTTHMLSLLLTIGREAGSGNVSLTVSPGFPIEMTVTCLGPAPSETGVDI